MRLSLQGVRKTYGETVALGGISLDAEPPEFVCLLGPSGCGKTTLLRMIAGLVEPDAGQLLLDGADLTRLPARRRGFGIVFQAYSLFPNMTAAENIGYGLKIRGESRARIAARVAELLALVALPDLGDRYPYQLSGGQQQRVALARAVAVDPKILLLDEPLSALDAQVRAELRHEIRALQRRLGILTIMVTHDQEEALALADRIVCMRQGGIAQAGTPAELYRRPANRFVAEFLGLSNILDRATVDRWASPLLECGPAVDGAVACIRPEDIALTDAGAAEATVPATVAGVQFLGNLTRVRLAWGGGEILAERPGKAALAPGTAVGIDFGATRCVWVTPE